MDLVDMDMVDMDMVDMDMVDMDMVDMDLVDMDMVDMDMVDMDKDQGSGSKKRIKDIYIYFKIFLILGKRDHLEKFIYSILFRKNFSVFLEFHDFGHWVI